MKALTHYYRRKINYIAIVYMGIIAVSVYIKLGQP